jgi:hypothetical protein
MAGYRENFSFITASAATAAAGTVATGTTTTQYLRFYVGRWNVACIPYELETMCRKVVVA